MNNPITNYDKECFVLTKNLFVVGKNLTTGQRQLIDDYNDFLIKNIFGQKPDFELIRIIKTKNPYKGNICVSTNRIPIPDGWEEYCPIKHKDWMKKNGMETD